MKKALLSFCLAFFFFPVSVCSGAATARDDGLARIMFDRTYSDMFSGEEAICSGEKDILRESSLINPHVEDLEDDFGNLFGYDALFYDKAGGYMEWTINPAPCGCSGAITAAAYAKSDGSYFFLRNDRTTCNYSASNGIRAGEPPATYLPKGFGLQTFLPEGFALLQSAEAGFYLSADIPRQGTDTALHLLPIPFGLYAPNQGLLLAAHGYGEKAEEKFVETDFIVRDESISFYKLSSAVRESDRIIFDPDVFTDEAYPTKLPKQKLRELLLSGEYAKIGEEDRALLENLSDKRVPIAHLSERLRFFAAVYEIHKNLIYDTLILGWNPDEGRFYIKEKRLTGKTYVTFHEPVC